MNPNDRPYSHDDQTVLAPPSFEKYREEIAEAHDIQLFFHYSETEAAKLLRLSVSTLKRARQADSIGHIRKGQKGIAYFGYQLVDFLIVRTTCPKQ